MLYKCHIPFFDVENRYFSVVNSSVSIGKIISWVIKNKQLSGILELIPFKETAYNWNFTPN